MEDQPKVLSNKSKSGLGMLILGLVVGILFTSLIVAGLIFWMQNGTIIKDSSTKKSDSKSESFLSLLNSNNLEKANNFIFDQGVNILKAEDTNNSVYTPGTIFDIASDGVVSFRDVPKNEQSDLLTTITNIPLYDQMLISSDGKVLLLINLTENKVSNIYIYKVNPVLAEDEEDGTDPGEDTQDPDSEEITRAIKLFLNSPKEQLKAEKNEKAYAHLRVENTNMDDAKCKLDISSNNISIISSSFTMPLAGDWYDGYLLLPGDYTATATCPYNTDNYTTSLNLKIAEAPGSICDDQSFNITSGNHSFAEVKSKFVGNWKGCALTPWSSKPRPYRVEFTFTENGKYASKNIEKIENPETVRKHVALYYGLETNNPSKAYELNNQLTNGDVEGKITIIEGNNADELEAVKLSADGKTLYFELLHAKKYGPIKYILTRQE
jgi:hypothetical protein